MQPAVAAVAGGGAHAAIQVVYWMWMPLPELAGVVQPLRDMLDESLQNTRRSRRMADSTVIAEGAWTEDRTAAW